jgi:hypothetical protein
MDEETKPQEQEAPPVPMQPRERGVGELMKEGTRKAVAGFALLVLIAAYLAGLTYAEVHGLNLLRTGVAPDLLMWAYIGMVSLGALAIALPLLLHFHAFDPTQRLWTYIFYALDILLLGVNSFIDFSGNNGRELVQWAQMYRDYILPSTPVIASVMATVLLLLDPHTKALVLRHTLRAAMVQKQADKVIEAANDPRVNATIDAAAGEEVTRAMEDLFGYRITPIQGYVMDTTQPKRLSLAARFFDYLYERVTRALSSDTPGQSQPSPSDEPSQDQPPQA